MLQIPGHGTKDASLQPVQFIDMLMSRDAPVGPPRPPGFDPEIYASVPIFNRRADSLALVISFTVNLISGLFFY